MARASIAVALLTVLLPAASAAQIAEPLPAGRFAFAPFVGLRVGHTVEFTDQVGSAGATVTETLEVDGGPTIGAALHVPLVGRLSAVGSATWSFSEEGTLTVSGDDAASVDDVNDSGTILFARAGLGYQFVDTEPESRVRSVAAVLSVGPVAARLDSGGLTGVDPQWHWGVAIGADALLPLGERGLHFYLAADDYLMFWAGEKLPTRRASPGAFTDRDAESSNILTLRAGLAYRF
jgi:hypothetical protein